MSVRSLPGIPVASCPPVRLTLSEVSLAQQGENRIWATIPKEWVGDALIRGSAPPATTVSG